MPQDKPWVSHAEIMDRLRADAAGHCGPAGGAEERIRRYGAPVGCVVEHHPRLDRCMLRLRHLVHRARARNTTLASGTVVVADSLSGSSGRFDRSWHAPEGGLWLALAWADTLLPRYSALLPLAVGIACCETVRALGVDGAIRWVNDVHAGGRKLAGILSETMATPDGERFHLLGIGLNVNNMDFPPELTAAATSLRAETGCRYERRAVAIRLLARLAWNIGLVHYCEERGLAEGGDAVAGPATAPLIDRWRRLSDSPGRRVVYGYDVVKTPLYRARVEDIDPEGGLRMVLDDGSLLTEYSGEIRYLD
ncbi:MAG TPA: biotin--[acetyl-CoA-carboxylase] ligase [Desulfobulbus sp.]|nr:biotin--[acetyl-CoA-carboxylase] ligase [Desulfobulbus sp.]